MLLKRFIRLHRSTTWPIDPLTSLITSSFISFLQNRCPYLSQKKQNKTVVDEVSWLPGKVLSGNPFVWERKQLHMSSNDVCHKHRETVKGMPIWGFTLPQNIYFCSFIVTYTWIIHIKLLPWLQWVISISYCRQTKKIHPCTSLDTNYSIWWNSKLAKHMLLLARNPSCHWIYRESYFKTP